MTGWERTKGDILAKEPSRGASVEKRRQYVDDIVMALFEPQLRCAPCNLHDCGCIRFGPTDPSFLELDLESSRESSNGIDLIRFECQS